MIIKFNQLPRYIQNEMSASERHVARVEVHNASGLEAESYLVTMLNGSQIRWRWQHQTHNPDGSRRTTLATTKSWCSSQERVGGAA